TGKIGPNTELTKFFPLKYADETDTIKQIHEILGVVQKSQSGNSTDSKEIESTRLVPIKQTHAIMVSTKSQDILNKIASLVPYLDQKIVTESGNVRIIRILNSDAKTIADTLTGLVQSKLKGGANPKPENITFFPDTQTNSILVTGAPQVFSQYEPILKSLDIMSPQIFVEILIAEISGSLSKHLGIEWIALQKDKTGMHGFGATNFGLKSQTLSAQGMQIGLLKDPVDLQKIKDSDVTELSKIKALINLYQNDSDFNILSTPQILTTNNEESKFTVGEVVALPQGFTKDRDSGRFDLTNFKYEDVGLTLAITPSVKSNEVITLKINQEIKKRQEENLYQFNVPVLTKRQMETKITVPNHETIVIGGLMREDKTSVVDSIPLFSNIPLIGKAFKNKRRTTQKTNLLVILTPHILSTPKEVSNFNITDLKSNKKAQILIEKMETRETSEKMEESKRNGSIVNPQSAMKSEVGNSEKIDAAKKLSAADANKTFRNRLTQMLEKAKTAFGSLKGKENKRAPTKPDA
ncbi:hypothetical protein HYY75_09765, partial [bacterium]|nr:hypothetical protein [bacterium]